MRPPNKNRNNRNKSGRKPMGNVSSRVYESAGPEGKVRGTPQQIIEKYLNMARDAQTSGDRVMSENFLQHAEHYIRLLSAAQQALDDRRAQGQPGGQREGDDGGRDDDDFDGFADRFTQPERVAQQPEERTVQQGGGAAQSGDPRDQPRDNDRQRREPGFERPRDARDHDRPRREGGEDRPRREGGEDRPRREGGEDRPRREGGDDRPRREGGDDRPRREGGDERSRRERNADRSRHDEAAARGGDRRHGGGENASVASAPAALDTIDPIDDAALGPVATPENAKDRSVAFDDSAPVNTAPVDAATGNAAPVNTAPLDAAPTNAAPVDAAPEVASPDAAPEKPAPRRRRRRVADAEPAVAADQAIPDQATAD